MSFWNNASFKVLDYQEQENLTDCLGFIVLLDWISVDRTKALVCTVTSPQHQTSQVYTLYGDPDHYAYEFGNETRYNDSLSMNRNWITFNDGSNFLHWMSIEYKTQRIYFGNNLHQRLEIGLFVHYNQSSTIFFDFVPETNQVSLL